MPARKSPRDDNQGGNADPSKADDTAAGAEGKQSDAMRNKKLATRVAFGIGFGASLNPMRTICPSTHGGS